MKRLIVVVAALALGVGAAFAAGPTCSKHDGAKPEQTAAKAEGHGCAMKAMKGIEKSLVKIDGGVKITFKSKDAKQVKALQEHLAKAAKEGCSCGKCPMAGKDVTRTVENTADGAVLTAVSKNPETVKALQAMNCNK